MAVVIHERKLPTPLSSFSKVACVSVCPKFGFGFGLKSRPLSSMVFQAGRSDLSTYPQSASANATCMASELLRL